MNRPPSFGFTLLRSLILFAVVALLFGCGLLLRYSVFLSSASLLNIAITAAMIGLVALPGMLLISGGHIDLSVGGVILLSGLAFCATVDAMGSVQPALRLAVGVSAALLVGVVVGLAIGLLTALAKLPSLVVTLPLWIALPVLTNQLWPMSLMLDEAVRPESQLTIIVGLAALAAVFLVTLVLSFIFSARHKGVLGGMWPGLRGQWRYGTRATITAFVFNGLCAAGAGTLYALRQASWVPTESISTQAWAAIGVGGSGGALGTLGGALLMALVWMLMAVAGLESVFPHLTYFGVLLLIVLWGLVSMAMGKFQPHPADQEGVALRQQRPLRSWVARYQVLIGLGILAAIQGVTVCQYTVMMTTDRPFIIPTLYFVVFAVGIAAILLVLHLIGGKPVPAPQPQGPMPPGWQQQPPAWQQPQPQQQPPAGWVPQPGYPQHPAPAFAAPPYQPRTPTEPIEPTVPIPTLPVEPVTAPPPPPEPAPKLPEPPRFG
ncbi:MAG: hypothetical protein LBR58_01465 [Propionibacteriaceae bacterium]|jgi:ribose transport system permease protein|nr:hypothetical protein [Propionibacteriaceae bacterium]